MLHLHSAWENAKSLNKIPWAVYVCKQGGQSNSSLPLQDLWL